MPEREENREGKSEHHANDKDSQMDEIFKKKHHYTAAVAAVFFILGLLVSPFTGISGLVVGNQNTSQAQVLAPEVVALVDLVCVPAERI